MLLTRMEDHADLVLYELAAINLYFIKSAWGFGDLTLTDISRCAKEAYFSLYFDSYSAYTVFDQALLDSSTRRRPLTMPISRSWRICL